jgi:hypothetical protein
MLYLILLMIVWGRLKQLMNLIIIKIIIIKRKMKMLTLMLVIKMKTVYCFENF